MFAREAGKGGVSTGSQVRARAAWLSGGTERATPAAHVLAGITMRGSQRVTRQGSFFPSLGNGVRGAEESAPPGATWAAYCLLPTRLRLG